MQIVVLNDFAYVDGGASQVALSSARALAQRGHKVLLFTGVGAVAQDLRDIPGLEVICLEQNAVLNEKSRMTAITRGLWNGEAAAHLHTVLQRFDPKDTMVHLHTYTKSLSSSVVKVALSKQFPVVLTLHDYFSVCPNGAFFIYPSQKLCHLRPMSASCIGTNCDNRRYTHKLWRVARQWTQERVGHLPAGIRDFISISDVSEKVLQRHLPKRSRIHRVPNPVIVPRDVPATPAAFDTFTFVGRLAAEKGPQLLADCAVENNLRVRFIGEGDERPKLQATLPDAEFTGWLDPAGVREALRSSRALVFPSLWYETQGLVVAEALALGLPAVVPSECAASEWIEDGVTGLVFRQGDRQDLGRKLLYLRDHPEEAVAMGARAYKRYWEQPMSMDSHCERLEGVYAKILNCRRQNDD